MALVAAARKPRVMKPRVEGIGRIQSSLYELYEVLMAPINLMVYMISFYIIDVQNERRRSLELNGDDGQSLLPAFWRALIYEPEAPDAPGPASHIVREKRWYYSTGYRKRMKSQARDAFKMQNVVLSVLFLITAGVAVGIGWLASWIRSSLR